MTNKFSSFSIAFAFAVSLSACTLVVPPTSSRSGTFLKPGQLSGPASAEYDTPPRLMEGNAPIYPISRLLKGAEGKTTITFTIAEDGSTKGFEVLSTDYEYYATHAIIAVKTWRFQPATKDGVPISVKVKQTFQYTVR